MVVVPVDANVDETEHIAEEFRQDRQEVGELRALRGRFQLEHHYGDDDREHAIAECFEPALAHENPRAAARFTEWRQNSGATAGAEVDCEPVIPRRRAEGTLFDWCGARSCERGYG